jgi:hypothetical protein
MPDTDAARYTLLRVLRTAGHLLTIVRNNPNLSEDSLNEVYFAAECAMADLWPVLRSWTDEYEETFQ